MTEADRASQRHIVTGLRKRFAGAPVAQERSYSAGMFSFNAGDGRCPTCGGSGFEHVEMQFLSDVYLRCPDCDGKRFRAEMLDVKLTLKDRDLSVSDVLELTVAEAVHLFSEHRAVLQKLQPIVDVGLDYVRLGQPVPTLSGGEAQRLKLAAHLPEVHARLGGLTKGQVSVHDPKTGSWRSWKLPGAAPSCYAVWVDERDVQRAGRVLRAGR